MLVLIASKIVIQKNCRIPPFSFFVFQKDELRRKTKGYLPECDVAFIDEIFKVHDVGDRLWPTPWKINMEHNHRGLEDHFPL